MEAEISCVSCMVLCTQRAFSEDQEMPLMLLKFMEWNSSHTLKDPQTP